jgi:dipeptidase
VRDAGTHPQNQIARESGKKGSSQGLSEIRFGGAAFRRATLLEDTMKLENMNDQQRVLAAAAADYKMANQRVKALETRGDTLRKEVDQNWTELSVAMVMEKTARASLELAAVGVQG